MTEVLTQAHTALQRANEIRSGKFQRKLELKRSPDPWGVVLEVLREPDEYDGAFTVSELLTSVPYCGLHRARELLKLAERDGFTVPADKRLRDLTQGQRARLHYAIKWNRPKR